MTALDTLELARVVHRATGCPPTHPALHMSEDLPCQVCARTTATAVLRDTRHRYPARLCALCFRPARHRTLWERLGLTTPGDWFALLLLAVAGLVMGAALYGASR